MDNSCLIRQLDPEKYEALSDYLQHLGSATRSRFAPHGYEPQEISGFYGNRDDVSGYLAYHDDESPIIAYSVIKYGILDHDFPRLHSLGIQPDPSRDCTYAPSVADNWQGKGIGGFMLDTICHHLKQRGIHRIILWGGVKADNIPALKFYEKHGFIRAGTFDYFGLNYDMYLSLV